MRDAYGIVSGLMMWLICLAGASLSEGNVWISCDVRVMREAHGVTTQLQQLVTVYRDSNIYSRPTP